MRYHKLFHLHGIYYESKKDPSVNRQRLVERITKQSVLDLERFEYEGKPALMVIDPKTGLDIGVVPADDVEKMLPYLDDPFFVRVDDLYEFDDGRCGVKLQFCVLADEEWKEMQDEAERVAQRKAEKRARPLYKVWWFYLIVAFFLALLYMAITGQLTERMMQ